MKRYIIIPILIMLLFPVTLFADERTNPCSQYQCIAKIFDLDFSFGHASSGGGGGTYYLLREDGSMMLREDASTFLREDAP
jgi:hypothetical protein